MAYVGTYYALAMSWPFTLLNCFLAAYSEGAQRAGALFYVSSAVVSRFLSAELSPRHACRVSVLCVYIGCRGVRYVIEWYGME